MQLNNGMAILVGGNMKYEDDNYILSANKSGSAALYNWPCSCLYCEIKL